MEKIKAVVQKVISEGNHGPFAVATSENIDSSITFSLEPTVWQEDQWPEQGMIVILDKLRKKRAGWRAMSGRFFEPSDEQTEIRKQERRNTMLLFGEHESMKEMNKSQKLPEEGKVKWLAVELEGYDIVMISTGDNVYHKDIFAVAAKGKTVNVPESVNCPWKPTGQDNFVVKGGGHLVVHSDSRYEVLGDSATFKLPARLQNALNTKVAGQLKSWTGKEVFVDDSIKTEEGKDAFKTERERTYEGAFNDLVQYTMNRTKKEWGEHIYFENNPADPTLPRVMRDVNTARLEKYSWLQYSKGIKQLTKEEVEKIVSAATPTSKGWSETHKQIICTSIVCPCCNAISLLVKISAQGQNLGDHRESVDGLYRVLIDLSDKKINIETYKLAETKKPISKATINR